MDLDIFPGEKMGRSSWFGNFMLERDNSDGAVNANIVVIVDKHNSRKHAPVELIFIPMHSGLVVLMDKKPVFYPNTSILML